MKYLRQISIILMILFISNLISNLISSVFLLPGPIIGMIILFVLLKTNIFKLSYIEDISIFMFSILAMFFLPSGISIMNYLELIRDSFIPIIFIGIIVTIITLAVTMKFIDILVNVSIKKGQNND